MVDMAIEGIPLTASDRDIVQNYRNLRCACLRNAMPRLWNLESIPSMPPRYWISALEQSFRRTVLITVHLIGHTYSPRIQVHSTC